MPRLYYVFTFVFLILLALFLSTTVPLLTPLTSFLEPHKPQSISSEHSKFNTPFTAKATPVAATLNAQQATPEPLLPLKKPKSSASTPSASAPPTASKKPIVASPSHTHCFFYDRPPRTASTTIANALELCLHKSFKEPLPQNRRDRPFLFRNMLRLRTDRVTIMFPHFYIAPDDIPYLKAQCNRTFYVSSTAPIIERVWSAAKYHISRKNGNFTLSATDIQRAKKFFQNGFRTRNFLSAYPYLDADEKPLGVSLQERLVPDYVIRKSHIQNDLSELLHALGCTNEIVTINVHGVDEEVGKVLKGVETDDDLHQWLTKLAKDRNRNGLRKAKRFGDSAKPWLWVRYLHSNANIEKQPDERKVTVSTLQEYEEQKMPLDPFSPTEVALLLFVTFHISCWHSFCLYHSHALCQDKCQQYRWMW